MSNKTSEFITEGLFEARQFLYNLQADHPTIGGTYRINAGESTLDTALARLNEYRDFQPTKDPRLVTRKDRLKYDRELEEKRIALAEDLVRRVDPGPHEDPIYLALLAYEAAAIEVALSDRPNPNRTNQGWSKFLLGTIHSPVLNAFAYRLDMSEYTVVALFSALIEFAYQASKAVVAATNPKRSSDGKRFVTTDFSAEHIAAQIEHNPEASERLYRTLEAYFFTGYPRAFANEHVPDEHVIPLTLLISMTERWIIAHEFGHGLIADMGVNQKSAQYPKSEEFAADNIATMLTAMSAVKLDAVPPEFSLIGGTFALACLDIFRRGLSIVRLGKEFKDVGDAEHPPNMARAQNIVKVFNTFIETDSDKQSSGITMSLILDHNRKLVDTEAAHLVTQRAFQYPNVLLAIWNVVRPRLLKDYKSKRSLHPMWG